MTTVRRMRWWDLDAVLALEGQLFPDGPWSAGAFWGELARPETRHYVVAEESGTLVGYAGLMAVGGSGDVQTVAVAPAAQGVGVGRLLLSELMSEAARRSCHDVLLEVRADNGRAVTLYERFGFERISVRRGYYPGGVDGLVLRLRGAQRIAGAGGVPA